MIKTFLIPTCFWITEKLNNKKTFIFVYSPKKKENNERYIKNSNFLNKIGLSVPKIIDYDKKKGFFLIAEIGQAHEGSLALAHSFIDAVADSGADAIKFQTHLAEHESTLDEPFRIKFSKQDKTRYEYWRRMEFSRNEWADLMDHSTNRGLVFLSSPFSLQAAMLLSELNVPAWKVGSGETISMDLLPYFCKTGLPVMVSTGMSSMHEIDLVVKTLEASHCPYVLMQCTSKYPTSLDEVGLNNLEIFREKYSCHVGLSDHSGTVYPALYALTQSCSVIEVHVTFHRKMFGPDVKASITFDDLSLLVKARDAFHQMLENPVDKNTMSKKLKHTKDLFNKSICLKSSKPAGTVIEESDLVLKKPGTGISVTNKELLIGKVLKRSVPNDRLLTWDDIA